MPSVLLSAGAKVSTRLRRRHEAQKERDREYADNFEALRAENEERVRRLGLLAEQADGIPQHQHHDQSGAPQPQPHAEPPQSSSTPPPAYVEAMDVRLPRRRESGDPTLNRGSAHARGEHVTVQTSQRLMSSAAAPQQGMAEMQSLRPKGSMVDRRDWAGASAAARAA